MIEGLKDLGKTIFLTTHYMDEAQHLADRVAILRRGELVAVGDLAEIGAGVGAATVIRFRVPEGVSADELRSIVDAPVELAGDVASLKVESPQRPLYKLTGWAEERGVVLDGLEAVHPTLEDVFLELTATRGQADGQGEGPDGGGDG
jgi:ABC-2 type transport system ATP-binding protein